MSCQKCNSDRICTINAKSSDLNNGTILDKDFEGYVPDGVGIGGGDYIHFSWCLECGQIQGSFPLETPEEYLQDSSEEIEDNNEK